jgi:phosphoribosylaminoimidazolecarboxamide formyltransferase/IMP cyclohydrolase
MTDAAIERALISVSDKTGLIEFARSLADHGVVILSTGGTAAAMREAGIDVVEVAEHTGSPEILDGRVKTLHPKIHGGILGRRDSADHRREMAANHIAPIDMVVVNLYPFEATVAGGGDFATCIENIDIGGPALIRAAAKNHGDVTVVTDPEQYQEIVDEMAANGGATSAGLRRRLAAAAYARTGSYDAAIAGWFNGEVDVSFPERLALGATLKQTLRYGENPHQEAAFYVTGDGRPGVATAEQVQGKELSYNNLNDTDAAFELAAEFEPPACAIIKHANPCGVAIGESLAEAYEKALKCDPISAFGGIIAVNRTLDEAIVAAIGDLFAEVIIAPDAEAAAKQALARKQNLRLLLTGGMPDPAAPGLISKSLAGGYLLQSRDAGRVGEDDLKVVTKRTPSAEEMADLLFAFRVGKHVKSNTIVYVRDLATVGIGAGQMSRIDAAKIAASKGAEHAGTKPCVVASDAFFPFADGLLAAIEAGGTAVIQPGGSMRDDEVIAAADEAGIAMVFTGMRHFRH